LNSLSLNGALILFVFASLRCFFPLSWNSVHSMDKSYMFLKCVTNTFDDLLIKAFFLTIRKTDIFLIFENQ
jgi:hypothetical protein